MSGVLTFPFRAAAALVAAFAFAVPVLAMLHTRVPGTTHRALFEPAQADRLGPVEIGVDHGANDNSGLEVHSAPLAVQDVAALTSHQRILLTIATFGTVPRLLSGELSFTGSGCTYRTGDDIEIADNRFVVFEKTAGCAAPVTGGAGEATLVLRLRNSARVALVAFVRPSPPPRDALVLVSPGLAQAGLSAILEGDVADVHPESAARRIDLLAFMWDLRPDAGWLDAAIAICGVLVGCAVLAGWPAPPPARFAAARLGVAAFLAAFALGAAYGVLCPPFQVADEPSHFLVIAEYLGRPDLGRQAEPWAQRDMFQEIRFHTYRPFSPLDRGRPGRKWSEVSVPGRDLYGAVRAVWLLLAPLASRMNLPQFFLTVRLFHAVIFALATALFVATLRSATGTSASLAAAVPLFLVPALPQFAMHVSNYAPLLAAYSVLAAGLAIASWDEHRSWAAGAVIG